MLLYLVRHGKAEPGEDDYSRRLTEQGRKAVRRVARRLADAHVRVDRVQHSGLTRARETAEILAEAVGGEVTAVDGLGATDNVASATRHANEHGYVMLVGHLPFMERMASYLLIGDADPQILHFKTGAVACFSNADGYWILEWLMPPDLA